MQRQSNLELLRIIAIILIMVVHANYYTFGMPQPDEIRASPFGSWLYIGLQNVSVVCVDVFILLSGWFGIHPKFKSIGGLIFQCVFFNILLNLLLPSLGLSKLSASNIFQSFVSYPYFVTCYTVLYILTPVLNTFIEQVSKKTFAKFLIVYYCWAFLFGWLLWKDEGFHAGNTTLSFIGLYMLSRYVRLHTILPSLTASFWGIAWLVTILFLTTSVWSVNMSGLDDHLGLLLLNVTDSYLAPNVIFTSLALILFFSKLHFSSRFINWISVSAFSTVLLHGYMMDELYCETIRWMFSHFSFIEFLIGVIAMLLGYFIIGVLIDKMRIWLWDRIAPIIDPNYYLNNYL